MKNLVAICEYFKHTCAYIKVEIKVERNTSNS